MNRLYWLDVRVTGISEAEAWQISDALGNLEFRYDENYAEFEGDAEFGAACESAAANQISADIYRITGRFVRAEVNVSDLTNNAHLDAIDTYNYQPERADYEALSSLIGMGWI